MHLGVNILFFGPLCKLVIVGECDIVKLPAGLAGAFPFGGSMGAATTGGAFFSANSFSLTLSSHSFSFNKDSSNACLASASTILASCYTVLNFLTFLEFL